MVTQMGTDMSIINPCNTEIGIYSLPEYFAIMGRVVSIVVAPPADMGANFPKCLTISGANIRTINSCMMFDNRANVPNSTPFVYVMSMLDRE